MSRRLSELRKRFVASEGSSIDVNKGSFTAVDYGNSNAWYRNWRRVFRYGPKVEYDLKREYSPDECSVELTLVLWLNTHQLYYPPL